MLSSRTLHRCFQTEFDQDINFGLKMWRNNHGLSVCWTRFHEFQYFVLESQVKLSICFIQDKYFDCIETYSFCVYDMIEQSSVRSRLQCRNVGIDLLTADCSWNLSRCMQFFYFRKLCQHLQYGMTLSGQFACWSENDGLDIACPSQLASALLYIIGIPAQRNHDR